MKNLKLFLNQRRVPGLIVFCILFYTTTQAGTRYVWVGGQPGNLWNNSANWSPSTAYPGQGISDAVVIANTGHDPTLNVSVIIDSILIQASASLKNDATHQLIVSQDVVVGPNPAATTALLDFSTAASSTDLIIGGNLRGYGYVLLYGSGQTVEIAGNLVVGGFTGHTGALIGSTIIFNGSSAQTVNPNNSGSGTYIFDNFVDDNSNSNGVILNTSDSIEIDVDLSGTGLLNVGSTKVVLYGNMTLDANKFYIGNNAEVLELWGDYSNVLNPTWNQTISNAQTFYKVDIFNGDVYLGDDVIIKSNLNFDDDGDIVLQGHNLDLTTASISWSDAQNSYITTGFVVTDNPTGGYLKMRTSGSGIAFPVGTISNYDATGSGQTPSYTPITFKSSSGTPVLDVLVKDHVTAANGSTNLSDVVNKTWVVVPETTSQDFAVETGWADVDDESGTMDHTATYVFYRLSETDPTPWIPNTTAGSTAQGSSFAQGYRDSISGGSISIGTDVSSTFYIATGSVSALPVSLISFKAILENKDVILNWTTSSEQNNAYFEVQRSIDAANWSPIGKVEGHGTSNVQNNYSFVDDLRTVIPNDIFYYRLRQVDFNNSFSYSNICPVRISDLDQDLNAFPNPTNKILNISWISPKEENTMVRIVNMRGENVFVQNVNAKGNMQQEIDMSVLPSGIYYLQIVSDENVSKKLTIFKN